MYLRFARLNAVLCTFTQFADQVTLLSSFLQVSRSPMPAGTTQSLLDERNTKAHAILIQPVDLNEYHLNSEEVTPLIYVCE